MTLLLPPEGLQFPVTFASGFHKMFRNLRFYRITNPKEDAFFCFRFYGAKPELWEKKWILHDPELVK